MLPGAVDRGRNPTGHRPNLAVASNSGSFANPNCSLHNIEASDQDCFKHQDWILPITWETHLEIGKPSLQSWLTMVYLLKMMTFNFQGIPGNQWLLLTRAKQHAAQGPSAGSYALAHR